MKVDSTFRFVQHVAFVPATSDIDSEQSFKCYPTIITLSHSGSVRSPRSAIPVINAPIVAEISCLLDLLKVTFVLFPQLAKKLHKNW